MSAKSVMPTEYKGKLPIVYALRDLKLSDKQKLFFQSEKKHVAYGGARGGGKSWAMRMKMVLLCITYPELKCLLIRRTYKMLENNHIQPLTKLLNGYARYNKSEKCFYFPNGSTIRLGYCDGESDVLQYQGAEYDCIGFEEATQLLEDWIRFISTCLRSTRADFKSRIYYTCNPGGVGHAYIKRLFIDREFDKTEPPDDYEFIQALVYDNEVLMDNDPEYIRRLEALPPELRKAHLEGSWDVVIGQYFTEFRRDIHVIEPFAIPREWRRYRAIDFGLDSFSCVWVAISPERVCYVYREIDKSDLTINESARMALSMTASDEEIYCTYAPPDMWGRSQESGKTKADIFYGNGLRFTKSSNNREAGWLSIKELLGNGNGQIRLKIFSTCTRLIYCLPLLMRDDKHPTDCAQEPHEITHLPDALRYFAVAWTRPNKEAEKEPSVQVMWTRDMWEDYCAASVSERQYMKMKWGTPNYDPRR